MPDARQSRTGSAGWLSRLLRAPKNSRAKTLLVPLIVSVLSAVLVAGAAISLRPQQQLNQERNRQQNILAAADLLVPGTSTESLFRQVVPRVVDLTSGDYAPNIDPSTLEPGRGARDPLTRVSVPRDLDIALIKERSRYAVVYLLYEDDRLNLIILPVYGYGLWSTMFGYVALEADANTIVGLRFYQHGETPGLGGEIDNPKWQRLWRGKKIYGESAEPLIEVIKGQARRTGNAREAYQVDGITGATLTGGGVTNLLRYWFGEHGFGPYLQSMRENSEEAR